MAGNAPATPTTVGTTNSQGLSDWAAPYITDYLGKSQALSNQPYQTYQGPLTAGASDLQNKVFQGLGNLTFPGNLGQSFSSTGAPTIGADGKPVGGTSLVSQYMNPYLQGVLDPQIEELRRQAGITGLTNAAKANQYGAFGGSRAALMDAELNRNTQQEMNKTINQGYSNAFDKAMGQFNTEQTNAQNLAKFMTDAGGIQRGITAEGVAADREEFNKQRQFPYEQVKFMRDMISGLPVSSVSSQQDQLSGIAKLIQAFGGLKNAGSSLKNLGIGG